MSTDVEKLTRYQKNKDKILQKAKEYYEKNKEKKEEYYEKNKEKNKEYYEKNKERIKGYTKIDTISLMKMERV